MVRRTKKEVRNSILGQWMTAALFILFFDKIFKSAIMEKQETRSMKKIPLAKPDITDLERKAVLEVLKTPILSLGPKLKEFEKRIADFVGVKYAVAVNSGTSALHLIIRSLGIEKGDEIITTPFSFISSSNCILFEGARPVFVDIHHETFNIDPSRIEEKITKRTKAILAVDVFGEPADWQALQKIAKKHKLLLVEDSAEALGTEYQSRKCGSFGIAGVFGFYPNKQIVTGEGGMIVTNNKKLADLCYSMRNQGRDKNSKWLNHQRLGYNYRISEINCALGIAQMRRIKEILAKRRKVANIYNKRLSKVSEISVPFSVPIVKRSWFVYYVLLNKNYTRQKRDEILKKLRKKGISCKDYFSCIHLQPFYKKLFGYKKGDFPIAEFVSDRIIVLPFYNDLKEKEIDFITRNLKQVISEL